VPSPEVIGIEALRIACLRRPVARHIGVICSANIVTYLYIIEAERVGKTVELIGPEKVDPFKKADLRYPWLLSSYLIFCQWALADTYDSAFGNKPLNARNSCRLADTQGLANITT
jgi:hypothetical protein